MREYHRRLETPQSVIKLVLTFTPDALSLDIVLGIFASPPPPSVSSSPPPPTSPHLVTPPTTAQKHKKHNYYYIKYYSSPSHRHRMLHKY